MPGTLTNPASPDDSRREWKTREYRHNAFEQRANARGMMIARVHHPPVLKEYETSRVLLGLKQRPTSLFLNQVGG